MRRLGPLLGAAFLFAAVLVLIGGRRFMRVAVNGHSMEPTLLDGDWLFVDRRGRPLPPDIVVAWDPRASDRLIVKRVREVGTDSELVLESDHPAHADEVIGSIAATSLVGTVRLVYWPPRRVRRV